MLISGLHKKVNLYMRSQHIVCNNRTPLTGTIAVALNSDRAGAKGGGVNATP